MGNIIFGPFDETSTLCAITRPTWIINFSTHAQSSGTSPVYLPHGMSFL